VLGRVAQASPVQARDAVSAAQTACPACSVVRVFDMGLQDFRDTDHRSILRVKAADGLLPIGAGIERGINIFEANGAHVRK
jgi:hypothetical protein